MTAVRRPARPRARRAVLTAGCLAILLPGCGGRTGDKPEVKALTPEAQVRVIVESFGRATANKDYGLICTRLVARSLSDHVEELGLPCELAFKKGLGAVKGADLRIEGITVRGKVAYAKVHTTAVGQAPSDDTMKLELLAGQWRIASLDDPAGSRRAAAKAAARFRFF